MAKESTITTLSGAYDAEREREENAVGLRLAKARKEKGWNQDRLTEELKRCGVSVSKASVAKWELGNTVPSVYQFLAVCEALGLEKPVTYFRNRHAGAREAAPELNEEGEKLVARYRRDLICSGNYRPALRLHEVVRYKEMQVAILPAAAGTGNRLDDSESYETVSYPADQVPDRADVGIRVSGDSMEPVFHDGQTVWVERCMELSEGEVGIFIYDGSAYIKVYHEQLPQAEYLEEFTDSYGTVHPQPVLISYNRGKYSPIEVSPYSTFRIFGRVLK